MLQQRRWRLLPRRRCSWRVQRPLCSPPSQRQRCTGVCPVRSQPSRWPWWRPPPPRRRLEVGVAVSMAAPPRLRERPALAVLPARLVLMPVRLSPTRVRAPLRRRLRSLPFPACWQPPSPSLPQRASRQSQNIQRRHQRTAARACFPHQLPQRRPHRRHSRPLARRAAPCTSRMMWWVCTGATPCAVRGAGTAGGTCVPTRTCPASCCLTALCCRGTCCSGERSAPPPETAASRMASHYYPLQLRLANLSLRKARTALRQRTLSPHPALHPHLCQQQQQPQRPRPSAAHA